MNEIEIQTSETIETLDKKEKDWQELHTKLEEYKRKAQERDQWKNRHNELLITLIEEEIKHLKDLYLAKVGLMSPEALATMKSDCFRDMQSRAKAHDLCVPREPVALQENLQDLMESSIPKRKEYCILMLSLANEKGLEQLLNISWRAVLQIYFDKAMNAPATLAAYLAYPCVRTQLQMRLSWCLMVMKRSDYEASNDSRSKDKRVGTIFITSESTNTRQYSREKYFLYTSKKTC